MEEQKEIYQQKKEAGPFKMILTLGLAGLLSGALLAFTYIFTKPTIDENKRKATYNAIFDVLPDCNSVVVLEWNSGELITVEGEYSGDNPLVYKGLKDNGELAGFAIPAEEPGFQDIIGAMVGYDPFNEWIIGLKILESKETPGLGDKIFKDKAFQENFRNLITEPQIEFVKKGEKNKENQVEGITGATISSKAVTNMLVNTMNNWKSRIKEHVQNE